MTCLTSVLQMAAAGQVQWKDVMKDFWAPLENTVATGLQLSVVDVIDHLDDVLEPMLFPKPAKVIGGPSSSSSS